MTALYDLESKTIQELLNHRTIRAFKRDPIDEATLAMLYETANRAATSNGLQQFSMIRITDQAIREALADISGQAYLATAPELVVFIVDLYRNQKIAEYKGTSVIGGDTADVFFQGFSDALIAAQSLNAAAESLGLGTVYFGSILNDVERTIEILKLPALTFPVVGLGMGIPDQMPASKPRLPLSEKLFENTYERLELNLDALSAYDEQMSQYADLRDPSRRLDAFSDQVVTKLSNVNENRQRLLNAVAKQGFRLMIDAE